MSIRNQIMNNIGFRTNSIHLSNMKDIEVKKTIFIGDGMSGKTQILLTFSQIILDYLYDIYITYNPRNNVSVEESALRYAEAALNSESTSLSSAFIQWAEKNGFLIQYGRVKWDIRSAVSLDTETIGFEDFHWIFPYLWNEETYRIHLSGADVGGQNIFDHLRNVMGKIAGKKDSLVVVFDRSRALSCWNSVEQVRNAIGDKFEHTTNIPRIYYVGNKIDLEEHIRSQGWQVEVQNTFTNMLNTVLNYGKGSYQIPSLVNKHGDEREIHYKLEGTKISFPDLEAILYNAIRTCSKHQQKIMTDVNCKSLAREISAQLVFDRKTKEVISSTISMSEESMVAIMKEFGGLLFQRRPLAIQYSGGIEYMHEGSQSDSFGRVRAKWKKFDLELKTITPEEIKAAIVSAGNSRNLISELGSFYSTDALKGIGVPE
ncbi:MAG: hypothetical protein ACW99F_16405, partial [Candidatus Hodarchaeales archaeon]